MSEEKRKHFGKEIQKHFAELISKNLKVPVFVVNSDKVDEIIEVVKQLPDIEKKYSANELYREVSHFVSKFTLFRSKNDKEVKKILETFLTSLEKEKRYEATIVLPGVIGLPVGTKIGHLEIIERNKNDKKLDEHLCFLEERKHLYTENRSHGKIKFKAYTSINVLDVFYKELELPFGILSLITYFDLDVRDCAGIIRSPDVSTVFYLEPHKEIHGWSRYSADIFSKYLKTLSNISLNKKPNRLQQKILQAIQIFGLSRLSHKSEIRLLLLISSFESLLLTENDRDYLGQKLSEKTSFLLENEYKKRLKLYKLMKELYGKRSGLVHRGKSEISDIEVKTLEHLFRNVTIKILDLSKDYTKMEQKSHEKDREGIEDYINNLRFS